MLNTFSISSVPQRVKETRYLININTHMYERNNQTKNQTIDDNIERAMDDLHIEVEEYPLSADEEEAIRILRSMPRRRRREYIQQLPSFIGKEKIRSSEDVREELNLLMRLAYHPDFGLGHLCFEERGILMDRILHLKELLEPIHGEADEQPVTGVASSGQVGDLQEQTTTFMDNQNLNSLDMSVLPDPTRVLVDNTEVNSLAQFLQRPRKLETFNWTPGGNFSINNFEIFNPLALYFVGPVATPLRYKIQNYRNLRFKGMRVQFRVNGSPFHAGLLRASFMPGRYPLVPFQHMLNPRNTALLPNNYGTLGASQFPLMTHWSQYPGVFIDPRTNDVAEFVIPFFYPMDYMSLVASNQIFDLGQMNLWCVSALSSSNGSVTPITVTIHAWLDDPVVTVPTDKEVFVGEADEYAKGAVSGPATAIGKFAGKLTDVPVIGPYAVATKMAAGAVAKVASLFGYSRPINIDKPCFVNQRPFASLAITSGEDTSKKLTFDPKQEITIDPKVVGLSETDEMSLAHIWQRESMILQASWASSTSPTTNLFNIAVHPCACPMVEGAIPTDQKVRWLSAIGGAVQPFTYWRGSIKYRIQIVASQMHRGRLAVVWNPTRDATLTSLPDPCCTYQQIIDITECRDYVFEVQYGHPNHWLEIHGATDLVSQGAVPDDALAMMCCNGYLSVYVVNALAAPTTTSSIFINVYISAGDDFKVAVPGADTFFEGMSPFAQELAITYEGEADEQLIGEAADYTVPGETAPVTGYKSVVLNAGVRSGSSGTDEDTLAFFGEQIVSVRALIKRFSDYYRYSLGSTETQALSLGIDHPHIPQFPGNANNPISPSITNWNWDMGLDDVHGAFNFVKNTYLSYFRAFYAGYRGNVRYKYIINGALLTNNYTGSVFVYRDPDMTSQLFAVNQTNNYLGLGTGGAGTFNSRALIMYQDGNFGNGYTGTDLEYAQLKNGIEFEHPFYSHQRFHYNAQRPFVVTTANDVLDYQQRAIQRSRHKVVIPVVPNTFSTPNGISVHTYVAAGEDFSLHYFCAAPVVGFAVPSAT